MLLSLLLLACPKDIPPPEEGHPTEPVPPVENPDVEGRPPAVVEPGPGLDFVDTCGAERHKDLVGQPKEAADGITDVQTVRVHCDTCPVTEDYFEGRLNVVFDAGTGLIVSLNCG